MRDGQPRSKLEGIEAGRGVAALLVVSVHCMNMLSNPKDFGRKAFDNFFVFGHAGVDFFFVLSGFVILYAHYKDIGRPQRIWKYLSRRLTRIYPIYWVATLFIAAIFLISPTKSGREMHLDVVLQSIVLLFQEGGPVLGTGWSLQHEMMFYVLFAVLVLRVEAGILLFTVWAGSVLAAVCFGVSDTLGYGALSIFNIDFFLGMGAALFLVNRRAAGWLCILSLGLLVYWGMAAAEISGVLYGHGSPARMIYGSGAMLTIVGLVEAERSGRLAVPRVMRGLGKASYSIYLFHIPVILIVEQSMRWLRFPLFLPAEAGFLIAVAVTVAASMAISERIEYPLLRASRAALERGAARLFPTRAPSRGVPETPAAGD